MKTTLVKENQQISDIALRDKGFVFPDVDGNMLIPLGRLLGGKQSLLL